MRIPEYYPPEKEGDNNIDNTPLEAHLAHKPPYHNEHDHRGGGMDRPMNDTYHFDKRGRPPPPAPPSSDNRHFKVWRCFEHFLKFCLRCLINARAGYFLGF